LRIEHISHAEIADQVCADHSCCTAKKLYLAGRVTFLLAAFRVFWFETMSTLQALQLSATSAAPLATVFRSTGGASARVDRTKSMGCEHIYRADASLRAIGLIDSPSR